MNQSQHYENRKRKAKECFKNASESIGVIEKNMSLFGVTRGQFSMIDIILHCINSVGPCEISLWTWCIADYEIKCVESLMQNGKIKKAMLIIDSSARLKNKDLLLNWIDKFGEKSIKYVVNHSKIATIKTDSMNILIRGSMNLNNNPRFEQFDVDEGHKGFDLVKEIENELPYLDFKHSNSQSRKISKINKCWSQQELIPFGELKTWAK